MAQRYHYPEPARRTIGLLVRDCRVQRGDNLRQFATACGVSRTAVAQWECHRMCPDYEHREQIARLYPAYGQADERIERRAAYRAALHDAATAYTLTYVRRATV